MGKEKQYLKLSFLSPSGKIDGLYFGDGEKLVQTLVDSYGEDAVDAAFEGRTLGIKLSFTYYPQINSFRGTESIQIVIDEWRL